MKKDHEFAPTVADTHIERDRKQQLAAQAQVGTANVYQFQKLTKAKLNLALTELVEGNVSKVSKWLDDVAARNPAEAVRLFQELVEFTQPRLKAAQVIANLTPTGEGQRALNDMSIEELQRVVAEG